MKRILIIGAGGIGRRHIRGFLATGKVDLSIVEPNDANRDKAVAENTISSAFTDLAETDLSSYDAAVICAPAHVHIPLATECAKAGTHFLLEKPLAVNLDGVDDVISEIEKKNLCARVAYVRRSGQDFVEIRDRIRSGEIGELKLAYLNSSQEYPRYRPDYRQIYFARPETGGGTILDAASHHIDLLIWLMGPVSEVSAMYDRMHLQGVEVEDTALINLRLRNGCMANITINQFQKPNVVLMEFIGTTGNLRVEGNDVKFADDDSGNWKTVYTPAEKTIMDAHESRFRMQAELFLAAIEGEKSHLTTFREARHNLEVALAAKKSYIEKTIVSVDAEGLEKA